VGRFREGHTFREMIWNRKNSDQDRRWRAGPAGAFGIGGDHDKIVREIGTAEKFKAFFGCPPKRGKVTPIDMARAGRESAATAAPSSMR
jgi:hypothetical protein